MPGDLTEAVIEILRRRRASGDRTAYLDPQVVEAFFAGPKALSPPSAIKALTHHPTVRARPETPAGRPTPTPQPVRKAPEPPPPADAGQPVATLDLEHLRARVAGCTLCALCKERNRTVFGDGDDHADLMFIGEGPGRDEDLQGIPFVGAAGQLLTRMIAAMQYERSEVYIANIVKCRPPRNRNPEKDEAAACLPYLKRQIELIAPKVIVILGAIPLHFLLGITGITRVRGQWHDYAGIPVMPTYHPAYLIRAPERKGEAWKDLQQVMVRLGKDPAQTKARPRKSGTP